MYLKDYESRQAAHAVGVVPPLLELLKSDFPVIQHLALKTLQNITTDEDTRNTFREEKGFEKLMDILSNAVSMCDKVNACFYAVCLPKHISILCLYH